MNTEPRIVSIEDLLALRLSLPEYQRPYTWNAKSASTLYWDVFEAYSNSLDEYRIGSVILCYNEKTKSYDIVDGQQRLTTISLLLYCLDKTCSSALLQQKYGKASKKAISQNFSTLSQLCENLDSERKIGLKEYLIRRCSIVEIIVQNEQEAFQFFDSQNSRGKELAPHDLLKSYHLREMNDDSVAEKVSLINRWEDTNQDDLASFFKDVLYPLVRWFRGKDGLGYSSKKISFFKGIKKNNTYNFSVYHKSANLYIEQMNQNNVYEILSEKKISQFQLSQPLIAGKRFFFYTLHYYDLYKKIDGMVNKKFPDLVNGGRGDQLVRNLFINVLMFFVDRFGEKELSEAVYRYLFSWVYMLRISLYSVYEESINKYALGYHNINYGLNLFSLINQMNQPKELFENALSKPDASKLEKAKKKAHETRLKRYIENWEKYSGMGVKNV